MAAGCGDAVTGVGRSEPVRLVRRRCGATAAVATAVRRPVSGLRLRRRGASSSKSNSGCERRWRGDRLPACRSSPKSSIVIAHRQPQAGFVCAATRGGGRHDGHGDDDRRHRRRPRRRRLGFAGGFGSCAGCVGSVGSLAAASDGLDGCGRVRHWRSRRRLSAARDRAARTSAIGASVPGCFRRCAWARLRGGRGAFWPAAFCGLLPRGWFCCCLAAAAAASAAACLLLLRLAAALLCGCCSLLLLAAVAGRCCGSSRRGSSRRHRGRCLRVAAAGRRVAAVAAIAAAAASCCRGRPACRFGRVIGCAAAEERAGCARPRRPTRRGGHAPRTPARGAAGVAGSSRGSRIGAGWAGLTLVTAGASGC